MVTGTVMEVEHLPTRTHALWTAQSIHSNHPALIYLAKTTEMCSELNNMMKEINSVNVVPAGQETIARLVHITCISYTPLKQASGTQLPVDQQDDISRSLLQFFAAEQAVLATLSSKHRLFKDFHFLIGPTAAVLNTLKILFDKDTVDIISLIPRFVDEVRQGAAKLDQELGNAINLYSGLNMDS